MISLFGCWHRRDSLAKSFAGAKIAWLLSGLIAALLPTSPARAADPGDAILGLWHTTDDKSIVEVYKRYDRYCARIVSLKEPNWPADEKPGYAGKPKRDLNNPDPALRDRLIAGMQFMSEFVYDGKNRWTDGKIYDPEVGKTYRSKLTLVSTNQLEVRGFIGISLIGRTVTWTR